MKKNLLAVISAATMLTVSLTACGGNSAPSAAPTPSASSGQGETTTAAPAASGQSEAVSSSEEQYVLNLSVQDAETSVKTIALRKLADEVLEESNGRLKIEVIASGMLGSNADVLEQARMGDNSCVVIDAGRFTDYVPDMMIFDAPYLFENYEQAIEFTNTDIFKGWMEQIEETGIHLSCWNVFEGARNIWASSPMNTIEDLKGLKIRTGDSPVWQSILTNMGCVPVVMSGSEVYQGISQKVIDGAEGQTVAAYASKTGEVAPYVYKTEHFYMICGMAVGTKWYESLPDDLKTLFDDAMYRAGEYVTQTTLDNETQIEEKMKAEGITVVEPDKETLKAATDPLYDEFPGFRELKDQIQASLKK